LDISTFNKSIIAISSHHRQLEMSMNERMLDDWLMNSRKELKKGKEYKKTERV
jgi:hypothetical protein